MGSASFVKSEIYFLLKEMKFRFLKILDLPPAQHTLLI